MFSDLPALRGRAFDMDDEDLTKAIEGETEAELTEPDADESVFERDLASRILETGRTIKLEALLRWHHPDRGPVPPSVFVPLAEQSEAIMEHGRWVLSEACRHLVELGPEGDPIAMSVNVSGRQLGDEGFVEFVQRTLAEIGLPPGRLVLEMTKSVVIQDLESGVSTTTRLRDLGVRMAIDDFGTGYSSLSYLSRFPVDYLKIDRAFVATQAQADPGSNLVRTIVEIGRTLGLETIAEGIEEPGQLACLRSLGADLGQGFLLARPMSFERLRWFLRGTLVVGGAADASSAGAVRGAPVYRMGR